ncbi:hypothetical protein BC941DRAFT_509553 [Chlamydoabsidia padenii]|nr:hypothetical protein BC941DRAFT_509553 [Chlamydoabsidia padenii]
MGASNSKSQSSKQQRKNTKSAVKSPKPTKNIKNSNNRPPINNITTKPTIDKVIPESSTLPSPFTTNDDSSLPLSPQRKNDTPVGIDLYTPGTTPTILIRDQIDSQPISSLFPSDIPLSETLATPSNQLQSTITSFSSANSSTISNLSDLFSTASIDTPNSSLSTNSNYSKQFVITPANANPARHVSPFGDGLSLTQVTPINDKLDNGYTMSTSDYGDDSSGNNNIIHQACVAQSKINSGNDSLIDQGFSDLLYLANSLSCVEAYYPLAECYYLGYHHASRQPDKLKSLFWFRQIINTTTSLPLSTVAWAQYRIAILLVKGDPQGIEPDVQQALYYFELSAEHDNRYSQYMLGLHFQHGVFNQQPPNLKQALYWYERAARNRFPEAQVSLGQLILENLDRLVVMNGVASTDQQYSKDKWTRIAIHWLELAAKQNNVKAHVTLGGIYEEGDLVSRNPVKAIQHYEAATEIDTHSDDNQVILAHYFVGINYRLGNLVPQNNNKALKHLRLASDGDYAPAQRALGLMYLEGVAGLTKDESIAFDWLTKAAMQGDIQALGLLGQRAEQRGNSEVDLLSAITMYKQAAQSGSLAAQLSLANLLLRMGRRAEAYQWYQSMATLQQVGNMDDFNVGHVRQQNVARLMVARYKFNGWDGVEVDRALAYQEFVYLSDQQQLSEAHFWVAACYDEGVTNPDGSIVVDRHPKKAFDYYMKSALGGDLDGQFHVALILANGASHGTISVGKDSTRAFKWYTKAAERGHATAQYSLGLFYERGLSPVDKVQLDKAKFWYERASHQEHTTAMIGLAQLLLQESSTSSHQDALHWLHKAATKRDDKNYTAALRALASVFEQGKIAVAECDPDRYKKGWLLLQKACDKNDPLAWLDMARYHENGLGMEMDIQAALECLIHAESLGYQKARMTIGDFYYRHNMWKEALASYESIVKSNVLLKKPGWNARLAIARLLLIDNSLSDTDSKKWIPDVYAWLSTMVSQPVADLAIMEPLELLGLCYELGKGTNQDISFSMDYYKRVVNISVDEMDWVQERTRFRLVEIYMRTDNHTLAWDQLQITKSHMHILDHQCKASHALARTARFHIGHLLLQGEHSEQNSAEAQIWLSQAADEGDGNAALELANLLESSNDISGAKRRLEQGALLMHTGCIESLALLLHRTETNNRNKIMDILDRASKLGSVKAVHHQGRLTCEAYLEDRTPQLLETSFEYYMKAAAKGDQESMVCLGQLYDYLEQYDKAQIWFERSSSELLSSIMLIKYQLEGVADMHTQLTQFTFSDLVSAAQQLWQNLHPSTLDSMDRHTIGNICFFMGQAYHHQDQTQGPDLSLAEQWYCRSVEIDQHEEATYALGMLYQVKGNLRGAMDWFRRAAEKWNHAASQYQLGLYHAHGLGGLEINLVAAQRYLKLAAGHGLDKAKKELGTVTFMHAWDLWNNQKQYQRGLKQFEKAAALVPEALVELGHLYHTGFASEDSSELCVILKSHKQAFSYYSEAARLGNAKAALMIGSYYEEGYLHGMENLEEALKWYEKAYQWNCGPLAELAIGKLKHNLAEKALTEQHDVETALDLQEEAYTWFEESVTEDGDQCAHAKVMMALYHLKGWGRKPCDPTRGFNMLMALVDENNVEAFVEVAMCYEQGLEGLEKDVSKALYYWELAADMDDLLALRKTAEIYRLGLTGSCNLEKANYYGNRADDIERAKQDEREKSFCSTTTSNSSSSSSYASRRSSLNSLNQLY